MVSERNQRTVRIDLDDLAKIREAFAKIDAKTLPKVMDAFGGAVEDAARGRIDDDKRAPDGTRWDKWSKGYARTRKPHHSLLSNEGDLYDSLTHKLLKGGFALEAGSNMVYAGVHQYGSRDGKTPARPYLGIGQAERDALDDLIQDWFEGAFNDA